MRLQFAVLTDDLLDQVARLDAPDAVGAFDFPYEKFERIAIGSERGLDDHVEGAGCQIDVVDMRQSRHPFRDVEPPPRFCVDEKEHRRAGDGGAIEVGDDAHAMLLDEAPRRSRHRERCGLRFADACSIAGHMMSTKAPAQVCVDFILESPLSPKEMQ